MTMSVFERNALLAELKTFDMSEVDEDLTKWFETIILAQTRNIENDLIDDLERNYNTVMWSSLDFFLLAAREVEHRCVKPIDALHDLIARIALRNELPDVQAARYHDFTCKVVSHIALAIGDRGFKKPMVICADGSCCL